MGGEELPAIVNVTSPLVASRSAEATVPRDPESRIAIVPAPPPGPAMLKSMSAKNVRSVPPIGVTVSTASEAFEGPLGPVARLGRGVPVVPSCETLPAPDTDQSGFGNVSKGSSKRRAGPGGGGGPPPNPPHAGRIIPTPRRNASLIGQRQNALIMEVAATIQFTLIKLSNPRAR